MPSPVSRAWEALFFGPVDPARPQLLARGLLLILSFDCWLVTVPHGGRYGAGDFNVSHFGWLDALQPTPTRELYGALLLASGALALSCALGPLRRATLGLLTVLYTWAWAMSQLDSYQHHYFLSIALACLCCSSVARRDRVVATRDWGWSLLLFSTALVYGFTAIAKLEPGWRHGEVLRRIHEDGGTLEAAVSAAASLGLSEDTFFSVAGHLTVASQVVISLAFLAALLPKTKARAALRWAGLVCALAFHLGSEVMNLRIGWFAWYMMLLAVVALPPTTWRTPSWVPRADVAKVAPHFSMLVPYFATLAAVGAMAFVAVDLDLPGAYGAALLCAAVVIWEARPRGRSLGVPLAALISWVALATALGASPVVYDYHRFVGGDALRRGELDLALQAYGKANTHAPEGQGRWKKVLQVRQRMKGERPTRPVLNGADP